MAIRIDAAGDYISRTTDLPAVNFADPTSASFWIRIVTDRNAAGNLFVISNNTGAIYQTVSLTTDGTTLRGETSGGTGVDGTSLSVGQDYHIGYTRLGNSLKVYLNGVLDITVTNGPADYAAAFMLMGSNTVSWLNGRLSNIKIWTAELTQAEMQLEMMTIRPARFANLYLWTPNFPGATERLLDYSGNGRNWTANGTLTDEDPPPVSWGAKPRIIPAAVVSATALPFKKTMNLQAVKRAAFY